MIEIATAGEEVEVVEVVESLEVTGESQSAETVQVEAETVQVEEATEEAGEPTTEALPAEPQPVEGGKDATPATQPPTWTASAIYPSYDENSEILDEISQAERDCQKKELEVTRFKRLLKIAKEEYDEAVLKLREIASSVQADRDRPLFAAKKSEPVQSAAFSSPSVPHSSADTAAPPSPSPATDWRTASISALGLKPKLVERLEEAGVSTIGKLEDLRAAISIGHEKWPKGIGQAKITEIENAVIDWLSKNRDSAVFATTGESSSESIPVEPVQADSTTAEQWSDLTDEQQVEFLDSRAQQIEEKGDFTSKHDAGAWMAGRDAFEDGDQISDCIYSPGEKQDDWIRGWFAGAMGEEESGTEEADTEEADAEENDLTENAPSFESELAEL